MFILSGEITLAPSRQRRLFTGAACGSSREEVPSPSSCRPCSASLPCSGLLRSSEALVPQVAVGKQHKLEQHSAATRREAAAQAGADGFVAGHGRFHYELRSRSLLFHWVRSRMRLWNYFLYSAVGHTFDTGNGAR